MAANEALERLDDSRRRVEAALGDLQDAFERELGWAPRAKAWILPLAGFAVGLALASGARRSRRRRAGRRA